MTVEHPVRPHHARTVSVEAPRECDFCGAIDNEPHQAVPHAFMASIAFQFAAASPAESLEFYDLVETTILRLGGEPYTGQIKLSHRHYATGRMDAQMKAVEERIATAEKFAMLDWTGQPVDQKGAESFEAASPSGPSSRSETAATPPATDGEATPTKETP